MNSTGLPLLECHLCLNQTADQRDFHSLYHRHKVMWMGVVLQALAHLGFPILRHIMTYMTFHLTQLFSYSYLGYYSMQEDLLKAGQSCKLMTSFLN